MAYDENIQIQDVTHGAVEPDSLDGKMNTVSYHEHAEPVSSPSAQLAPKASIRMAPPLVQEMSPEERHSVELKLKRKIDIRLLPMIVIMYF